MIKKQNSIIDIFKIFLTTIFFSMMLGLITNAINGLISPLYFKNILGWNDVKNIYRAIIAQGIFEGIIFGIVLSLIYTIIVLIISRNQCSYKFAIMYLVKLVIITFCLWILGGIIAIALAILSPDFYRNTFRLVPEDFSNMIGYAWVGGSIWGIQIGGFCTIIIGSFLFKNKWKIFINR